MKKSFLALATIIASATLLIGNCTYVNDCNGVYR